jgi:hypothetical protein
MVLSNKATSACIMRPCRHKRPPILMDEASTQKPFTHSHIKPSKANRIAPSSMQQQWHGHGPALPHPKYVYKPPSRCVHDEASWSQVRVLPWPIQAHFLLFQAA